MYFLLLLLRKSRGASTTQSVTFFSTFSHKTAAMLSFSTATRTSEIEVVQKITDSQIARDQSPSIQRDYKHAGLFFIFVSGMFNIWDVMGKCATVAKKEVFYVWPFGLAAWLTGTIFIDRSNAPKANERINKAAVLTREEKGSREQHVLPVDGKWSIEHVPEMRSNLSPCPNIETGFLPIQLSYRGLDLSNMEMQGGNWKSPRKPTDQLHCPTRFPHAKIRKRPRQEFSLVCLLGGRQVI
ncbi:hypothetical protein PR048_021648 [Dryococelus australis]|uniref:Phospholipid/glycerol acyltransferase domain-containing protein n=1 Tax=Dryococelus australis TaxID=614101 RepID=A0ABQ9GYS7_9NEOP|nr:hypothetical protein PR048_021648 [Dryococelus australis]